LAKDLFQNSNKAEKKSAGANAEQQRLMEEYNNLGGMQKAAIVLVSLGTTTSAQIFSKLTESQIEILSTEVAKTDNVNLVVKEMVLEEFNDLLMAQKFVSQGGINFAERVLVDALGKDKATSIIERVKNSIQKTGFDLLGDIETDQVVNILQHEHPQTIALLLAHLDPVKAASILSSLNQDNQIEVTIRLATMGVIAPSVIDQLESVLSDQIKGLAGGAGREVGGVEAVAQIMNTVDMATEKNVMGTLEKDNPELATTIKNLMFVTSTKTGTGIHRELFNSLNENDDNFLTLQSSDEWLKNHINETVSTMSKSNDVDNNAMRVGALFESDGEYHWSGQGSFEKLYINDGSFAVVNSNEATINFSLTLEQGNIIDVDASTIKISSLHFYDDIKQIEPYNNANADEVIGRPIDISSNVTDKKLTIGANSIKVNIPQLSANRIGSFHMVVEAYNNDGDMLFSNVGHFSTRNFVYAYRVDTTYSLSGKAYYNTSFSKKPLESKLTIGFEDESGTSLSTIDKGKLVYLNVSSTNSFKSGNLALSSNGGSMVSATGAEITKWADKSGVEVDFTSEGRMAVIFNTPGYHVVTASGVMADSSMDIGVSNVLAVQGDYNLSTDPMKDFNEDGYLIMITPNPVKEKATIKIKASSGDVLVKLFKRSGELVKEFKTPLSSNNSISLPAKFISQIDYGEYYVLLEVDGVKKAGKWFYKIK